MKVKKVTYFGEFCYLKSSWIRKSITLMFLSSSRNKFTLLYQNSVTDVFVGFLPPCWCPSRWAPAWRLHTNFYKFAQNISWDIAYTEYSSDLNLGEGLCMFTSFHFPYFLFYLVNRFDFYFNLFWMAWHWKQTIVVILPTSADVLVNASLLWRNIRGIWANQLIERRSMTSRHHASTRLI